MVTGGRLSDDPDTVHFSSLVRVGAGDVGHPGPFRDERFLSSPPLRVNGAQRACRSGGLVSFISRRSLAGRRRRGHELRRLCPLAL